MRGGETKILKRGCKLGQGVGALKRGGLEPPYELRLSTASALNTTTNTANLNV